MRGRERKEEEEGDGGGEKRRNPAAQGDVITLEFRGWPTG